MKVPTATMPEIAVLGPVALGNGGEWAPVRGQQGRVLCMLVAAFPHAVATDRLVEALWGDRPPDTAASGLSVVLHRLRARLGGSDRVVHEQHGYRLAVEPACIDAHRFAELVARAAAVHQDSSDEASDLLAAALELWRGGVFEPFADTELLQVDAAGWTEQRLSAEDALLDLLGRNGARFEDAAALGQRLVAAEPYREHRWVGLARSLYRSGRQTEALRATAEAARILRSEVGVEPGEELRALEAVILAQADEPAFDGPTDGNGSAVGLAELVHVRTAVPPTPDVPTSFVGRDDVVENLGDVLHDHRLVTVVGDGGAGKTRLALQILRSATTRALWLDLSTIDETAITQTIASQLGVSASAAQQPEVVIRALDEQPTLVVFDNCEHVREAAGAAVGLVLGAGPDIRVLATSRLALGHEAETVFAIPALEPDAASRLLVDRAFGPGSTPSVDPDQVRTLVERLGANPLLIELLAEPVRALSVEAVNDQLERVLGGEARTAGPARHASLEATVEWSLRLVDPPVRDCFDALGVLRGAFTVAEVAALLEADPIDVEHWLQTLCRHGLLGTSERTRPLRFRQPEAISIESRRRLGRTDRAATLEATHTVGYLEMLHSNAPRLWTADEQEAVRTITTGIDQLAVVHRRLVDAGDAGRAGRLAIAMWDHAFLRLDLARLGWAGEVLKIDGVAEIEVYPELLATAAMAAWARNDFFTATRLADEAIALAPDDEPPLEALRAHFNVVSFREPATGPVDAFNALITHTIARGEPHARCDLDVLLSLGLLQIGEKEGAFDSAHRAAATAEELRNPSCLAWAGYGLGWTQLYDDPAGAARRFVDAGRLARTVDNRFVETMARGALATCLRRQGRLAQATDMLLDVIGRWDRLQTTPQLIRSCREAALLLADGGREDQARLVLTWIEHAELGHPLAPPDQALFDELVDRLGPADEPVDFEGRAALGQRVLELLS